ncbi:MAG: hypothetical protein ACOC2M_00345 [bacterium]
MKDLTMLKEINVLGYSGMYLALLFETLYRKGFQGMVNIFMNDNLKRAEAPFETNIDYKVCHYSEMSLPPSGNFVFCSNKPSTKQFLMNFFQGKWRISEDQFISFFHPSSVVSSTARIGNGFYMEPLSVISPYAKIGFGVTINRNCSIGHHNILHDYSSVHSGSNLAGDIVLFEGATIGPGCTIFNSIKIGKNSVVGGGSVVTRDIPDNVLAFGNPCKVVKQLD